MSDLDDKLRDALSHLHHNTDVEAIAQIKQAFTDAGYMQVSSVNQEQQAAIANMALGNTVMTGQEWYDRFKAEYHNKADWISAEPDMGDDAEHDVLLAARLAANIEETN